MLEFASVRELQGALNRLVAHAGAGDGTLTPAARARDRRRAAGRSPGAGPRGTPPAPAADEFVELPLRHRRRRRGARRARGSVRARRDASRTGAGEGYRTAVLERAAVGAGGAAERTRRVLRGVRRRGVEQLRAARGAEVTAVDPSLGGDRRVPRSRAAARGGGAASSVRSPARVPPPGPSAGVRRDAPSQGASRTRSRVRAADAVDRRARAALQPAVHARRPSGVGQDAPAATRSATQLRAARRRLRRAWRASSGAAVRRRADRRAAGGHGRALARALPRGRRAAHRRRAVRRRQGAHAGRAVPRLQRTCTAAGKQLVLVERSCRRRRSTGSRSGCGRGSRAASSSRLSRPTVRCARSCYARYSSTRRRRRGHGARCSYLAERAGDAACAR